MNFRRSIAAAGVALATGAAPAGADYVVSGEDARFAMCAAALRKSADEMFWSGYAEGFQRDQIESIAFAAMLERFGRRMPTQDIAQLMVKMEARLPRDWGGAAFFDRYADYCMRLIRAEF